MITRKEPGPIYSVYRDVRIEYREHNDTWEVQVSKSQFNKLSDAKKHVDSLYTKNQNKNSFDVFLLPDFGRWNPDAPSEVVKARVVAWHDNTNNRFSSKEESVWVRPYKPDGKTLGPRRQCRADRLFYASKNTPVALRECISVCADLAEKIEDEREKFIRDYRVADSLIESLKMAASTLDS